MRLLYISSEYPPETGFGGIGTYTKHIAESLVAAGHSVSVITLSTSCQFSVRSCNGVTIYRIPPAPYPLPPYRWAYLLRRCITKLFPHTLNRLSWAIAVRGKIKELCQKERFNIIESPECGAEGVLIPRHACQKYIVRLHTPWVIIRQLDSLPEAPGDQLSLPLLEKINIMRASALSSPSRAMLRIMQLYWPYKKAAVIHNPLPVEQYDISQGKEWMYTGRIEHRKGVHVLIAAYKQATQSARLPRLHLYGGAYGSHHLHGEYGSYIRSLIDNSDMRDRILWHGRVSHESIRMHLRNASVVFFPSLWENFPYSCLEAMACGCIVVASNCGGFKEILQHNSNGFLTTPGSTHALQKIMLYLNSNQNKLQPLRRRTRKAVIALADATTIAEQMKKFYMTGLTMR